MTTLLVWFMFICIILVGLTLLACLMFFIAAVFYGLYKGVRDLIRGRDVQVQDQAVSPPVRGAEVSEGKRNFRRGLADGAQDGKD